MDTIVSAVPLWWILTLSAALFCIGLYGTLTRRNTIGMLLGIELMLYAANVNLVDFWRYFESNTVAGQVFALFVIIVAAAEAAVGFAMAISIARNRGTVNADEIDTLRG